MKKTITALLFLTSLAQADVKLSQLPLGAGTNVGASDSFPYVDAVSTTTKRLLLDDLINVPAISTQFGTKAPLASPSFTGTTTDANLSVTGTSTLNGRVGLGGPPTSAAMIYANGTAATSGVQQWALDVNSTFNATGGITNVFGIFSAPVISGGGVSGTATNVYSLYAANPPLTNTGVITNAYGVYIPSITSGGANWGLYSAGATTNNFIAGTLGVGATSSGATLELRGTGNTSGTSAFLIKNSTPAATFEVKNDGEVMAYKSHNTGCTGSSANSCFGSGIAVGPTCTNLANTVLVNCFDQYWMRVGNMVTFEQRIDLSISGGAGDLKITPPIAATFSSDVQVGGSCTNGVILFRASKYNTDPTKIELDTGTTSSVSTVLKCHITYMIP